MFFDFFLFKRIYIFERDMAGPRSAVGRASDSRASGPGCDMP